MDNQPDTNNLNLHSLIELSNGQQSALEAKKQAQQATENLVWTLWPKLTAMYGFKFASQFGEEPDETWVTCLRGITGRQMADGLNECLTRHPEWPPAAVQFRSACLGIFIEKDGTEVNHGGKAYKPFDKSRALTDQTELAKRKVAGRSALDEMLGSLKEVKRAAPRVAVSATRAISHPACTSCGFEFDRLLNICEKCKVKRDD